LAAALSPESIGAILVAAIAVVLISTQVVAGPAIVARGSPSPAPSASQSGAGPTIPPIIRSALATALVVNERLAAHADTLTAAVAAAKPAAEDIATILRAINTEMTVGNEAANRLIVEPATAPVGVALVDFYGSVAGRNAETLGTSIRNTAAYVAGGRATIKLLDQLPALNDQIKAALENELSPSPQLPSASPSPPRSVPPSVAPTQRPTPTAPPTGSPPSPPPGGSGLVPNGGFEDGLTGWSLYVLPPAVATSSVEAGAGVNKSAAARVDIAAGSDSRSGVSLAAGAIGLRQGTTYTLQVSLRAASPRDVRIRLTGQGGLTYAARVYPVGTAWSVVTFDVDQLVTDPNAQLAIDLGRETPTIWVDNVAIREGGG
jgi:hypothetical protein